ncbi:MAG: ABC transporter ATP-binding protein [Puniceicoccales bacterium]|jgi:lipopolysaccharide transport system ATP-binding protein|nr:ABC transporter ATP-binding protein [Puniceicoccales bacterium]
MSEQQPDTNAAPATQTPIISIRNAGICYRPLRNLFNRKMKEVWALRNLNLDLYEGEKLGILGRNGCGKSTLTRLIAQIYAPDEGTITYHKKDIHVELLSLGIGFESNLSGRENAILSGMLMGKSRKYMISRLEKIREFSGLGDFFDLPVYSYSSGMAMRLGFSVAIETAPDILIVDEVLGVGDQVFMEKSSKALKGKFQGNRTVILISHSPHKIKELCTRAIWLERGAILAEGDPGKVSDHYLQNVHLYAH